MPDAGRKPELTVVRGDEALRTVPDPPEHLGERGREFWSDNLPALVDKGVVTRMELPSFTQLCELYESKMRAWAEWRKGPTLEDAGDRGRKKSPAWTQYKQAAHEFRMMLESFGLTPATRKKLGLDEIDDGEPTGMDALRAIG